MKMEIKLGEDFHSKSHYHDRKAAKLQHKINQEILKHELDRAKKGKH